jgi:hypothetical protein
MNYWLTTHYKHHTSSHPYSIYLKDRYKKKADEIEVGDQVAFYELRGKAGGSQAVVAIAEVSGGKRTNVHRDGGPDIGDQIWQWEIPCGPEKRGKVSRTELNRILGWKSRAGLRIPGGIMKLEKSKFEEIARSFRSGS